MTIPLTAFRGVPARWRTPATAIAHVTPDIHKQRDAVKAVTEILCLNRHWRMHWIWPQLLLALVHELNICVNSPSELVHASGHDYIPVCNDCDGHLTTWEHLLRGNSSADTSEAGIWDDQCPCHLQRE